MKKLGLLALALCLSMFVAGCKDETKAVKKPGDKPAVKDAKPGDAAHEPAEGAKDAMPAPDAPKK